MDVTKRFAKNLIEQREKRGLSPEDLARQASIPLPHLESMEGAGEQPEMETLIKLAGSLEIPVATLVAGLAWDPVAGFTVADSP